VPDDDFFDFDAAEADFEGIDAEVTDVSTLSDSELMLRFREVTDALMERKEALRPKTQGARDLHSERAALRIELAKRKLM
jgi:hypothetical protein